MKSAKRTVVILAFDGCQVLDVTGPAAVFAAGNDAIGDTFYEVRIASLAGGEVRTTSAVGLFAQPISSIPPKEVDTLLIAGGDAAGLRALYSDEKVRAWALTTAASARRFGSICNGAFAWAHFGLLFGKRVATHWSTCAELSEHYPDTMVDANALFVNDGRLWTSAGVTTGIDMTLEMVGLDLGKPVANAIAKRLVLYARRPGYQAQFSPVLKAQTHADAPFAALIQWMREHLNDVLDVPQLASRSSMSERTFLRKFTRSIGETPAHFVETLRLDQVRHLLATGRSLKEIAVETGYSTGPQMSKAFARRFGMTPLLFRELHCHQEPSSGDSQGASTKAADGPFNGNRVTEPLYPSARHVLI